MGVEIFKWIYSAWFSNFSQPNYTTWFSILKGSNGLDMQKILEIISFLLIIIEANGKNVLYQDISNDEIKRHAILLEGYKIWVTWVSHRIPPRIF